MLLCSTWASLILSTCQKAQLQLCVTYFSHGLGLLLILDERLHLNIRMASCQSNFRKGSSSKWKDLEKPSLNFCIQGIQWVSLRETEGIILSACDTIREHLMVTYTTFLGGFQGTQYLRPEKTLMLLTYREGSRNFAQFKSGCRMNVELVYESMVSIINIYSVINIQYLLWVLTL